MNETRIHAITGIWQSDATPSVGSVDREGTVKGFSIMIVEDHDVSRTCLEGFLRRYGYRVRSFTSAEEGLGELKADAFEVLLTDLRLPGMDGFELIAKARVLRPSIRVLMMTAEVSRTVHERARIERADAVMEKPIELDQLMAFLEPLVFLEEQEGTGCK